MAERRWVATDLGGPEVVREVEADVPEPGPGEVTIEVRAAGMNPADVKGFTPGRDRSPLPLGYELLSGGHPGGTLALVR
jgi:NADPH2:quinone reductase